MLIQKTASIDVNKESQSVSVVIPNYNGESLLKKNLPSVIAALDYVGVDSEIIISDDCSTDNSVSFVKKTYPFVKVIVGDVNLGFSGNINRGMRVACKKLVFALNSDIFLEKDYFSHQLSYFNSETVFAVMGAVHDPVNQALVKLNLDVGQNFFGFIKAIKLNNYNFNKSLPMLFPSGSNMLIDNSKLKELNYFNELFSPFYGEDADLGLRSWRMGWESYYEPRSVCYHESSATINKYNKKKKIRTVSRRNKLIFHDFHLQGAYLLKFYIKMFFDVFTRFIVLDTGYYLAFLEYFKLRHRLQVLKKKTIFKLQTQEALTIFKHKVDIFLKK